MRTLQIGVWTALVLSVSSPALAWEPFRSENDHVSDGNERMRANDPRSALQDYDEAARELPNEAGVHLNRGLALLALGELDRAREALLLATEPPATSELRADAYYDLGLAFYREGDAAAQEENHEEAQRLFREAADAFRRSLRLRPGVENVGWNLELALRRIQEQQEQQEQQEREQQEQQQQENQDQEQQENQDQEQQENQDQENQDPQQQDQENQDSQQDQENQDPQQQESDDGQSSDAEQNDQERADQNEAGEQNEQEREGERGDPQEEPPSGTMDGLPPEHRNVLEALEQNEDNFERQRARMRAAQENRRPEQDW